MQHGEKERECRAGVGVGCACALAVTVAVQVQERAHEHVPRHKSPPEQPPADRTQPSPAARRHVDCLSCHLSCQGPPC